MEQVMVTSQERCQDNEFVFNGTCFECPPFGAQCRDGQLWLEDEYWFNPNWACKHPVSPDGNCTEYSELNALKYFWGLRRQTEAWKAAGSQPVSRPSKLMSAENMIYRCSKRACVAEKTSNLPRCTAGRAGTLCGACIEGYYATNMLECKPCPSGMGALQSFAIFVMLAILAKIAWSIKGRVEDKYPELYKSIRAKAPEVCKLLTGMFQILGGFATILYRVPWPDAFSRISSMMGVVNLDIFAVPSIRCTEYGKTFYARFDLHMTSTLVVTALLVLLLLFAYSKMNKVTDRIPRALAWNLLLPFLFIIYPSVSKTAILMLRCRTVDGTSYLLSDIALSCETAEYKSHYIYAIFCVMVFPVGIVVFFMALVGYQREKLPPDWWPAEEKAKCKERYDEYRKKHGRRGAKKFPDWKVEVWDAEMAHHVKFYNRFGFLFAAYTRDFWWFESLITLYKLTMTVLILFVSDKDEPKILMGMMGATLMLGVFSFYQPFKNPDLLSINTGAQMVVLMVLFTAQLLIFREQAGLGTSLFITLLLIVMALTPLVAGVYMTLRVSETSYVPESSAELEKALSNLLTKSTKIDHSKGGQVADKWANKPALKPDKKDKGDKKDESQQGSSLTARNLMHYSSSKMPKSSSMRSASSKSSGRAHSRTNSGQLDDGESAEPDVVEFFGENPLVKTNQRAKKFAAQKKMREAQKASRSAVRSMHSPHATGATNPMHSAKPAVTEQAAPSALKKKKMSVFQKLSSGLHGKASKAGKSNPTRPANKRLGGAAGSKQESFMVPAKQMSHKSFDLGGSFVESRRSPGSRPFRPLTRWMPACSHGCVALCRLGSTTTNELLNACGSAVLFSCTLLS